MSEIDIRIEGRAGRITLNRPKALNALTWDMCRAIDAALKDWAAADIDLVLIDGAGERAFCAGGDLTEMYATGTAGDFGYGRRFWADEYRMNARLFCFAKPVVSFLHGFVMGGGVGVGCHGSHRIVGESSRVAMPECGVGLVPDVGGSLILARAPGRLGAYLGTTGARMRPGDAIHAGFADHFVPEARWADLKAALITDGDAAAVNAAATAAPESAMARSVGEIDRYFGGETLGAVLASLDSAGTAFAGEARAQMAGNSPLSMACTLEMLRRLDDAGTGRAAIEAALSQEYRFTWRSMEHGDFLEGIRALIIDKDKSPRWKHTPEGVPADAVAAMLAPLGDNEMTFDG